MIATQSPGLKKGRWLAAISLLAAGTLLFVSACSSGSSRSPAAGGTVATAPAAKSQPLPTVPAPTSPVTIKIGSSSHGSVVVDASGQTLYRFDKDTAGSTTSACNGACAVTWPPALLTGQPTAVSSLTGTLGVVTRVDGTRQISLDGHPLYRFSGDQKPGDTAGDGFGGIWHVVPASSSATTAAPAASTSY